MGLMGLMGLIWAGQGDVEKWGQGEMD